MVIKNYKTPFLKLTEKVNFLKKEICQLPGDNLFFIIKPCFFYFTANTVSSKDS